MKVRTRVGFEEVPRPNLAYFAFLAVMIACGLAARAFGFLPLQ